MIGTTIQHAHSSLQQDATEGTVKAQGMYSRSTQRFIQRIITDYGNYDRIRDAFVVDLSHIDSIDRKILLSHLLHPDDYEDALSCCQIRLDAVFKEYSPLIERLISEESATVWHDQIEEARNSAHEYA